MVFSIKSASLSLHFVRNLLVSLLLVWTCGACSHLEVVDDEIGEGKEEETSQPTEPEESINEEDDPLTVSEIMSGGYLDLFVWVEGYMVGYVIGNSMSASVFNNAPDATNTNFLLADSPDETDITKVVPVELKKGTYRDQFNFYDHPELMGCKVKLLALATTYFRVNGLKNLSTCELLTDEEGPIDDQNVSINLYHEATIIEGR
ncbi:MAG: hypothetical protein IKH52_07320 [Bacteroidaceae bacterium]|nr:hypothetical protein [Bacteroidaceae bacterium]